MKNHHHVNEEDDKLIPIGVEFLEPHITYQTERPTDVSCEKRDGYPANEIIELQPETEEAKSLHKIVRYDYNFCRKRGMVDVKESDYKAIKDLVGE